MGIIIRQSVKSAIWSYLGIVIGYINVGIIMPQFFDTAQVGLVQLFSSVSLIFAQFGTLGFTSVINRLFPLFRNPDRQHNGFLFLAMVTAIAGFIVSIAGFIILKPWIVDSNIERSPLIVEYLWLLMPLVFMRLLFTLLDNYNKMLYDTVTGTFWIEFMHKVINLVLIICFALQWINFPQFFLGYVLSVSLPVIPVIIVLIRRHHFSLKPYPEFLQQPVRREIGSTMLFGFINGLAGVILLNVDKIFVNQYLSLDEVGIFSVCALFATIIRIPYNNISKIATGVIAEAWRRNDKAHIHEIYQKAALNQAIAGTLIFTGILVNLDNIFEILPAAYQNGKWVLIIYSAGMLVNTILGLAGNITEITNLFRFTTLFLGLSIIIQIILCITLIPLWGINGAALATISTLVINSLFQVFLQRVAFSIYGVNRKLLIVLAVGAFSFLTGWLIPESSLITDILFRSITVTMVFTVLIYSLKISGDMNLQINLLFKHFFKH